MAINPPYNRSLLAQQVVANSFLAAQSAQLPVSSTTGSVTFTNVPGTIRVTAKITNTGTKGCYIASGKNSATAVVSTTTPQPTAGDEAVSNCDYIAAGAIYTQDYPMGTNTFAAICAGSDTTTLEISVGSGQ